MFLIYLDFWQFDDIFSRIFLVVRYCGFDPVLYFNLLSGLLCECMLITLILDYMLTLTEKLIDTLIYFTDVLICMRFHSCSHKHSHAHF